MGRFLIVASPMVGHVFPTIAVGRALLDRGHQVAWTGHVDGVGNRLPSWATFIPLAEEIPPEVNRAIEEATSKTRNPVAAFVEVWRDYVTPVARQMAPGVLDALDSFRPDVVVVDQQALAGAVAAEARGLTWATSATTPVELIGWAGQHRASQLDLHVDPATLAYLHKAHDWLMGLLGDLAVELGLDPQRVAGFDPRFSSRLVLAFTTAELLGFDVDYPPHFALVGPSIGDRPPQGTFPWEWLDGERPLVLVSLGTINWRGGARFFKAAAKAFATMEAQAVFIAPESLDIEPPPNVLVRERVPQLELLDRVDAVVTHGGYNTVCETLAVGRPMVLAPIRDDQPLNASQVEGAGAGLTVRYNRVTSSQLREAIESVLTDKRYRSAAERLQASFAAAGGPALAAERLEALLGAGPPG